MIVNNSIDFRWISIIELPGHVTGKPPEQIECGKQRTLQIFYLVGGECCGQFSDCWRISPFAQEASVVPDVALIRLRRGSPFQQREQVLFQIAIAQLSWRATDHGGG